VPLLFDGKNTRTCPRRPFLDAPEFLNRVFHTYAMMKRGHLPEEGGVGNQPAVLVECWNVVDVAVAAVEKHHRDDQVTKSKAGNNSRPPPRARGRK
jgi:hypothetical protein